MYDIITLGETMLRLNPPALQRIEQATHFEAHTGGSESNTAVGLARLGMRVCWLSRLTDNFVGHLIANSISTYGVDTSHVIWTDQDRNGLYFVEEGRSPRSSQVIYDRANSAMSKMNPDDLPADLFQADQAKLLHLTGITLAIGATEAAHHAMTLAKAAGWKFTFDFNFRSKLWSLEDACAICHPFMQAADVIFIPYRDLNTTQQPLEALRQLHRQYPQAIIVMTLSSEGSMAFLPDETSLQQGIFQAEQVSRIGGGDSFVAGFLYAYLNNLDDISTALRWGAAAAALKYTIPGDMPLFTHEEVRRLVETTSDYNTLLR